MVSVYRGFRHEERAHDFVKWNGETHGSEVPSFLAARYISNIKIVLDDANTMYHRKSTALPPLIGQKSRKALTLHVMPTVGAKAQPQSLCFFRFAT